MYLLASFFLHAAAILSLVSFVTTESRNHQLPFLDQDSEAQRRPYSVAIIGAGAAGSSAAYHLSKFARESDYDIDVNITIFEANNYIGGRTTTVNALNDPRYPVELGGSIFVEINQILYNATRDFGLLATDRDYQGGSTGSDYDLGIWDGSAFVFTLSNDDNKSGLKGTLSGWWDILKIVWKYGIAPFRLRTLQRKVIGNFLRMYDEVFPFKDLTEVAKQVDLLSVTSMAGPQLLTEAGVTGRFADEIIQASTRVNYAQNLVDFHGLETMVCMSTEGAMSVEGGNWQIFENMVKRSEARVHLNTTVHSIDTLKYSGSSIQYTTPESETARASNFDTVILAAPYDSSAIGLNPKPSWSPNQADYVSLHVTLFSSPFRPDPCYFGLDVGQDHLVPDTILTTLPPELDPNFLGRGEDGVGPAGFWSLSTLRTIDPIQDTYIPQGVSAGRIPGENLMPVNITPQSDQWPRRAEGGKQYLYKIFSPAPLSAFFLVDLFGWHDHPSLSAELMRVKSESTSNTDEDEQSITGFPKELITWSYEKVWNSYPYLPPTSEFDCFDIYDCKRDMQDELQGRLWYTSPIELFISTMETSALSGKNTARLIIDGYEAKEAGRYNKEDE